MNIIYTILQQIQSDEWLFISKDMERAKGKYKLGYHSKLNRLRSKFFKKTKI